MRYASAPFSPDKVYPELAGLCGETDAGNLVYAGVRDTMQQMGWDAAHFGTAQWNPMGHLVAGAQRIVIKPNLVLHRVGELPCSIESLVVHAAVLRPIVDYVLLAARRAGTTPKLAIADTPLQSADFRQLCEENGLLALVTYYREKGIGLDLFDLRFEHAVINDHFLILQRVPLPGDPQGARIVDLAEGSEHFRAGQGKAEFSIQDYDDEATRGNHSGKVQRYKFSQSILDADLVINVAKLKCHAKAGVTLALKNIVGANVSKDYLPHFRSGGPQNGGDEVPKLSWYPRTVRNLRNWFNRNRRPYLAPLHRILKKVAYRVESSRRQLGYETGFGGAWYGNDTLWRTIVDINRILYFADREGCIHDVPQRKVAFFLDGVVGMQGDGPLKGTDLRAGVLACGDDPVEFDACSTYLMGFDPSKVPHIAYWGRAAGLKIGALPQSFDFPGAEQIPAFHEPSGWKGKLRR